METSKPESKIKKFLAPDLAKQREIRSTFKEISYYILIALISILVVFVVPLISGALYGDFSMYFPKTAQGWLVYWCIRGGSAGGNIALFILFKLQAKVNVRNDPNYIEAQNIIRGHSGEKGFIPRSPKQMNTREYITKIITIFVTSILASVTISALAISFDFITFLSCIISTIIAICFGWVTMINNEVYWTDEYLQYAKYVDKLVKESSDQPVEEPKVEDEVLPEEQVKGDNQC